MNKHRIIVYAIICVIIVVPVRQSYAHLRSEHNEHIERVLFGSADYKVTHPDVEDIIQALQDATYLAVDQYNHSGKEELENLLKRGIPGLPSSISEIDFTGNYAHRMYTHRGWKVSYSEKSHWPMRKQILMNTVKKELFIKPDTLLAWFPWASEIVYGLKGSMRQHECFCALLYCIHIIGDHLDTNRFQDLAYIAPLARIHDRDEPGIIPELIYNFEELFESQKWSFTYIGFMQELDDLRIKAEKLVASVGGIRNEKDFIEYRGYAEKLLEILEQNVPYLLKNEEFFYDTFYKR